MIPIPNCHLNVKTPNASHPGMLLTNSVSAQVLRRGSPFFQIDWARGNPKTVRLALSLNNVSSCHTQKFVSLISSLIFAIVTHNTQASEDALSILTFTTFAVSKN